jgi:hypothetical protein
MLNLLLGVALVGVSALAFRSALPVEGRVRSWIAPKIEPYVAIAFVLLGTLGLGLMLHGAVSTISR